VYLPYGAPLTDPPAARVAELGLTPGGFHLAVARFEPENHVLEIVRGYRRSAALLPLIVVGAASYSHDYAQAVQESAAGDSRIRLVGAVWDQELLDQLYVGARSVLHGHSVGGTNPSLLRAMGAAARVTAYDCVFNREVTAGHALWFVDESGLAEAVEADEQHPDERGRALRRRAETAYRWDDVIDGYARLCEELAGQ
jgi:glycosyltransferase involved in cell wall biosynthesis